jgi:hypothetical protein
MQPEQEIGHVLVAVKSSLESFPKFCTEAPFEKTVKN